MAWGLEDWQGVCRVGVKTCHSSGSSSQVGSTINQRLSSNTVVCFRVEFWPYEMSSFCRHLAGQGPKCFLVTTLIYCHCLFEEEVDL